MLRILLLIGHRENRRLLEEWLQQTHEIIIPTALSDFDQSFDLILVDLQTYYQLEDTIRGRKRAEAERFLPVIVMIPADELEVEAPSLWGRVDDIVPMPVEKIELKARMETLLRVRQLGRAVANRNEQLRYEVNVRRTAERQARRALRHTRRLYNVSRQISAARTPDEVLRVIMGHYPKPLMQAAVLEFEPAWEDTPPECCHVLALLRPEWEWPGPVATTYTSDMEALLELFVRDRVVVVRDVAVETRLRREARLKLMRLRVRSAILFPLRAQGVWYGMLALYSDQRNWWKASDQNYFQGLLQVVAATIHNMRLLAKEAQARQEAERANQLKLQFLGMISHELRTPLTPIRGLASSLLADDVRFSETEQQEFIRIIDEEAAKLTRLVDDLIDVSRLQAGSFNIVARPTSISEIVAEADPELRSLSAHHALAFEIPAELPLVIADSGRIAQVLANLVGNAVKYAPPQTTIIVRAAATEEGVQIDVQDHGFGIVTEERETIFEVFRQGNRATTRSRNGAGLGLAICKGIVEAHSGKIWIQDSSGDASGATISFTLPLAAS